jgi:rhodanese-related sulfurtransferase
MLKSADDLIREAQKHIECVDVTTARKIYDESPDANTVIITHCGGGRASLAAHSLKQLGYSRVYSITAPFDEIKQVFG